MSNNLNEKKAVLRRTRSVPVLLSVPDLRMRNDPRLEAPSDDKLASMASAAWNPDTSIEEAMAAAVSPLNSDPSSASLAGMASLTASETTPILNPPSLDDLLAAAEGESLNENVRASETPSENSSPPRENLTSWKTNLPGNWFAGESWFDLGTIGTIVSTVIACALIARAMRPLPVEEDFARGSYAVQQPIAVAQSPDATSSEALQDPRLARSANVPQGRTNQNMGGGQVGEFQVGAYQVGARQQPISPSGQSAVTARVGADQVAGYQTRAGDVVGGQGLGQGIPRPRFTGQTSASAQQSPTAVQQSSDRLLQAGSPVAVEAPLGTNYGAIQPQQPGQVYYPPTATSQAGARGLGNFSNGQTQQPATGSQLRPSGPVLSNPAGSTISPGPRLNPAQSANAGPAGPPWPTHVGNVNPAGNPQGQNGTAYAVGRTQNVQQQPAATGGYPQTSTPGSDPFVEGLRRQTGNAERVADQRGNFFNK